MNGAITRGASGLTFFTHSCPSYMQSFIKIGGAVLEKNEHEIMTLCNFNKDCQRAYLSWVRCRQCCQLLPDIFREIDLRTLACIWRFCPCNFWHFGYFSMCYMSDTSFNNCVVFTAFTFWESTFQMFNFRNMNIFTMDKFWPIKNFAIAIYS